MGPTMLWGKTPRNLPQIGFLCKTIDIETVARNNYLMPAFSFIFVVLSWALLIKDLSWHMQNNKHI